MTQEEKKQMQLQCLLSLLAYDTIAQVTNNIEGESKPLVIDKPLTIDDVSAFLNNDVVVDIKPYLRPMSSMTIHERCEYEKILGYWECGPFEKNYDNVIDKKYNLNYKGISKAINWLNKNHFDYLKLIPIGLAIKAGNEMYGK